MRGHSFALSGYQAGFQQMLHRAAGAAKGCRQEHIRALAKVRCRDR
jgi:hypothetical protein